MATQSRSITDTQKNMKWSRFLKNIDLDIARRKIEESDIDVNCFSVDGEHPLVRFIRGGNLPEVQFLLEQGADPNWKDPVRLTWFRSPIMAALGWFGKSKTHDDILKLLLDSGADCNMEDIEGNTLFLSAVQSHSLECVKFLMEHGADIAKQDKYGGTALHYAAQNAHHVNVLQFILDQGLDIEYKDASGFSAFYYAIGQNNFEVCELLLRNGADVNGGSTIHDSPLPKAVKRDAPEAIIQLLLDYGATVTSADDQSSILITAVRNNNRPLIKLLTRHIAKLDYLNLSIDERDRTFLELDIYCGPFYKTCMKELEDMKVATFYNSVTVHDVFLESKKVISGYAKNEELVEALKSGAYGERFPIYFSILEKAFFVEVERQKLRKAAAETLSSLFKFNDPYHLVMQTILCYLRDSDLKILIFP